MIKRLTFKQGVLLNILLLMTLLGTFLSTTTYVQATPAKIAQTKKWHEADFVDAHCRGDVEFVLADRTRVDCLIYTQTTSKFSFQDA